MWRAMNCLATPLPWRRQSCACPIVPKQIADCKCCIPPESSHLSFSAVVLSVDQPARQQLKIKKLHRASQRRLRLHRLRPVRHPNRTRREVAAALRVPPPRVGAGPGAKKGQVPGGPEGQRAELAQQAARPRSPGHTPGLSAEMQLPASAALVGAQEGLKAARRPIARNGETPQAEWAPHHEGWPSRHTPNSHPCPRHLPREVSWRATSSQIRPIVVAPNEGVHPQKRGRGKIMQT